MTGGKLVVTRLISEVEYRGYVIEGFGNGTFDIAEPSGELVEGELSSVDECKQTIDKLEGKE